MYPYRNQYQVKKNLPKSDALQKLKIFFPINAGFLDSAVGHCKPQVGPLGQRVFYVQAFQAARTVTIIVEKVHLQSLSVGIEQFLAQLSAQNADLGEASADFSDEQMRISPPVEPIFRAGEDRFHRWT